MRFATFAVSFIILCVCMLFNVVEHLKLRDTIDILAKLSDPLEVNLDDNSPFKGNSGRLPVAISNADFTELESLLAAADRYSTIREGVALRGAIAQIKKLKTHFAAKSADNSKWTVAPPEIWHPVFQFQTLFSAYTGALATRLGARQNALVLLNLALLLTMAITASLYVYLTRKKYRDTLQRLEQEKNEQIESNKESKNILFSLMYDLSNEKAVAVNIAGELAKLNDNLEEKNAEIESMASFIAHELKTPLIYIDGFSKNLHKEINSLLTERQSLQLQRITENVNHMSSMIQDLLKVSKLSYQTLEFKPVDTSAVVKAIVSRLNSMLEIAGGVVNLTDCQHTIWGSEKLLSQVLNNLIVNAIAYRSPDRKLEIAIATKALDKYTLLVVTDNGIGIPEQHKDRVFGLFQRLANKTDIKTGNGVGLAMVKSIVDKHEGKISLESEEGFGTTISMWFPTAHQTNSIK